MVVTLTCYILSYPFKYWSYSLIVLESASSISLLLHLAHFPQDMSICLPRQSCCQRPGMPLWWVCKQSPLWSGAGELEQEQDLMCVSGGS